MWEDPIVAEVRAVREAHAAKFNYDIAAICADLKRMEKQSGRKYVSFPPRLIEGSSKVVKARRKKAA